MKLLSKKFLIFTIILVFILSFYAIMYLNTIFIEIAEVKAKEIVSAAITKVINEESKKINVSNLIISDDKNYIQINSTEINRIGTTISSKLQQELDKTMIQPIKIPVLSALGLDILAGFGPNLAVKIVPVGFSTVPAYEDQVESKGINNIRYKIYAIISAEIKLIVPLKEKSIRIKSRAPIVDIVIEGDVPDTYMNFGS
ncbi:MAG: sporulation protein YunB [Halanaerobiaceae bacterium]